MAPHAVITDNMANAKQWPGRHAVDITKELGCKRYRRFIALTPHLSHLFSPENIYRIDHEGRC